MRFSNRKQHTIARLAIFTALALVIWLIEELVPRPMPWLRLGFSYIVIIVAMESVGIRCGALVAFLRVFIGSLILGKLFSPAFFLSLSGTAAAIIVMSALFPLRKKFLSLIGISIAGAFAHIAVQILVAGALFYRPDAVLWLLPPMTIWTIAAGALVGIIATAVLRRVANRWEGA